ncbi:penicillin-binding protein 2 [Enterobacteriaceae endosymbiont of Donacia versicolorea]|nr:penicillin-binding protein 2 [Enterobacteriaceae endosymbiont of Donacia versicolorea]
MYDRNGIVLAKNLIFYRLKIKPNNTNIFFQKIINLQKILKLKNSKYNIINIINKKIKNNNYKSIILKFNLSQVQKSKFLVNKYKFPEISLVSFQKRFYPHGRIFSHVIGYVKLYDNKKSIFFKNTNLIKKYIKNHPIGVNGIEKYYENLLYGTVGYQKIATNNQGEYKYKICKKNAYTGSDIFLTIDFFLQKYIYSLMTNIKGVVIVSNPKNGNILAMVSTPSYDPNLFMSNVKNNNLNILLKNHNHPLVNRAIQGIYPPASTVKPYLSLIALNFNLINENTILFDPGWWKIPKIHQIYKDWKKNGHGYLNIIKAIQESSDSFFYQLSYNIGINKIHQWMTKFGYGKLTNIDLFDEKSGNMPTKKWKFNNIQLPWYLGDTILVGIGQSYWNATPIQIHNALTILINNGISKTLHIYQKRKLNNMFYYYLPPKDKKVIDLPIKYWNIVKLGMYNVANKKKGTMYKYFSSANYHIAAKTGTAQVFNLKNIKKYNIKSIKKKLRDHKLIIAFAPFEDPKIAITIIIENSNISIGYITRKIFDYIFKHKEKFLI